MDLISAAAACGASLTPTHSSFMSTPIIIPPIQSGIYHIGSLVHELYLELQRDGSLRAMVPKKLADAQKVTLHPQF